ncbi:glycosyltransferase [uncultured Thiohalocapsa sp.]|uniref:glycosyltransferase n=1 Tax=uncultured Thiohalocapsa sp. TaxID=768990 RepID=UPI00345790F6
MLSPTEDNASVGAAPDSIAGALDGTGLRIAIVSDAAPERNGVGAYYRDLAEHLTAVGGRVDLISPRFRAGHWYGGLPLPLPGDPTQRFVLPSLPLVMRRMARLRPDVVIVPTPGPFGMLGMVLAKRWHARLVVGFHTHFERLAALNDDWVLMGKVAQAYLNTCNRALFREGALVLANSEEMLDIARRIGARRVGLMGTPIPKAFLDTPPQPLRQGVHRILFAGRLAPEKNLGAIVDAAAALPDLQFQVAGDGPQRQWLLEQGAQLPNLHYVGWVKRQQILPLIDGADVLVLPSTVESFGTIALEAMARGRLVVVSAACGILSWRSLEQGLFQIRPDETLADTLARLRAVDHAMLERKAGIARAAARELNDRNLRHWLRVVRDENAAGSDDVCI